MPFDTQQQQAIDTVGTSILVSASAGAGKTGVLVARLVKRCLKDKVPVSNILAVTFTKAAAAEMKKRVASRFNEELDKTDDENEKAYIRKQIVALETANITTIDSYCLTIIEKYYNVIGMNPAMTKRTLSEGEKKAMEKEAFFRAYRKMYELDEKKAIDLATYYSKRSEDYDQLFEVVTTINTNASSSMDPLSWYENAKKTYQPVAKMSEFAPELLDAFYSSIRLELEHIIYCLDQMSFYGCDLNKYDDSKTIAKKNATINCINAINESNYAGYMTSLENMVLLNTTADSKKTVPSYASARAEVDKISKKLLTDCYDEKTLITCSNELSTFVSDLIDLAQSTSLEFAEMKKENVCMDFNDMERLALKILNANNGSTAAIIRRSLKEIMVDEFQDTSELQNTIIEMIAEQDNVFRVGDVKQSIYRFRQAKPQLMRSLMEDPNNLLITLRHNYRSKQSIVEFNNILYEALMNIEGSRNTYSSLDHVTIGRDAQQEKPVPIIFANVINEDNEYSSKQLKAAWIAEKIISMKEEDPSLSYRDFCILTRGHADKAYLRTAFDRVGIPYDIDAREGFYSSDLCQTILSLCKVMIDPTDLISLAAALTSSFFEITDNEMARLVIEYKNLYQGILHEHTEILDEIDELCMISRDEGVVRMLSEIAKRHDFFARLDESSRANFDFLFEKTISSKIQDLSSLIESLSVSEEDRSSEAVSKGKDDDVVQTATIHRSKGLQYKIVFLWSTNPVRSGTTPNILIDDDLYLGIKHLTMPWRSERETIQSMAVSYRNKINDIEEFTRLLYVATTRAEERMFIVDSLDSDASFATMTLLDLVRLKGKMSDLFLTALEPSELFRIEAVIPDLSVMARPIRKEIFNTLPSFDVEVPMFAGILTPSSRETVTVPALDPAHLTSGRSYGTMIHETIESLPDRIWTEDDFTDPELSAHDIQRIIGFSESDLYQECLKGMIRKEYPFYIEKEVRITGTMDFVSVLENEVILIDFKTDHASASEIRKRYTDQLNTYRDALTYMYPDKKIRVYAYSFHNETEIEISQ